MEITTLCAVVATLTVIPNRSQFFQYESVSLSCGQQGNSSDWRVKRNTSIFMVKERFNSWVERSESYFFIDTLYPADSGVYWCESAAGERSEAVNITVTGGSVILESPVLPVMEGDNVTLHCINRMPSSSNLTADFYKDGRLIGSSSTGSMTVHGVSKSDEGLYKCNISAGEESPESWVTVRGRPDPPDAADTHVLLPVMAACLSVVSASVMLLCVWRSDKGQINPTVVFFTDVTRTKTHNHQGEPPGGRSCWLSSTALYTTGRVRYMYTPTEAL